MWQWATMMGLRKFQEMVFTGRPFTAEEMYECNFVNSVVPRERARGRGGRSTRCACAKTRPTDTIFMQKSFFEIMKQHQGEYMGSLLSAWLESMGGTAAERRRRQEGQRSAGDDGRRAQPRGEGQRQRFPRNGGSAVPGAVAATTTDRGVAPDERAELGQRVLAGATRAACGSSISPPGSGAPTAPSCSPTAAPRSSRSSRPRAIRLRRWSASGADDRGRKTTARSSTSCTRRRRASSSTPTTTSSSRSLQALLASADAVVWSHGSPVAEHPAVAPARRSAVTTRT